MGKKTKKSIRWADLKKRPNNLLIFVLTFALVCVLILVVIHASAPSALIEPELGTKLGNACAESDSSASGGSYVQFGCPKATVPIPDSIVSDCSVDVTPSLNAWLSKLPANTTAELKKDGCYLTEDEIDIFDKSNFTLHGNNSTFRRTLIKGNLTTGNHMHVHIARSVDVEVDDLNITGEKPDTDGYNSGLEAQHGFGLYALVQGKFNNVSIKNIRGDCFYFNRGKINGTTHPSQNITIQNSFCHQTGRHGAAFLSAADILITHSTFENNHRENFDFEQYGLNQGGSANNITIDDNDIGPASQLLVSEAGGSSEFKNFTFSNNRLHRIFTMVLEGYSGGLLGPLKIINNVVVDPLIVNHGGVMQIHGFRDVTITGNKAKLDSVTTQGVPNSYFVQLYYSHNVVISNNSIAGAKNEINLDPNTDTTCGSGNDPVFINLPVCN